MKKFAVVLAFCLASCASANDTALKSTEYVCVSATALLKVAVTLQPRISAADQGHISHAVSIINPVCSQDNVPTLTSTAKAALDSALAELTAAVPKT